MCRIVVPLGTLLQSHVPPGEKHSACVKFIFLNILEVKLESNPTTVDTGKDSHNSTFVYLT
jgi:hypothetical protein